MVDILPIIQNNIQNKILEIRGQRVMLDRDLAMMYGVPIKRLNEQVKRNKNRFPDDFMFQLTKKEAANFLRSQIATLKRGEHRKYLPFAFTEQGVAMLSSVLNSEKAIQVNITIMRIFVKFREIGYHYKVLAEKLDELEKKHSRHDKQIGEIFMSLRYLTRGYNKDNELKQEIGFKASK
ncbi:MAG: ORF6N domain-containing protein [Patescibacteria group bacterium]